MQRLCYFLAGAASPVLLWVGLDRDKPLSFFNWVHPDEQQRPQGLRVVITGSTRELGFAMARHFLRLGDSVVISSRSQDAVAAAVAALQAEFPAARGRVVGVRADASQHADVEALASRAVAELGGIDIWICNAGQSLAAKAPLSENSPQELAAIVNTNLTGALLGAREAIRRMQAQQGGGKVVLVDGNGSWGNPTPGNAAYGATKRALVQLKDSLATEVAGSGVGVHICSPGMVATELLVRYADTPRKARNINIIAEEPGEVAAWLVPRLRGVEGNGRYIRYLTVPRVLQRYATASQRRGRFIAEGEAA